MVSSGTCHECLCCLGVKYTHLSGRILLGLGVKSDRCSPKRSGWRTGRAISGIDVDHTDKVHESDMGINAPTCTDVTLYVVRCIFLGKKKDAKDQPISCKRETSAWIWGRKDQEDQEGLEILPWSKLTARRI